MWRCAKEDKSEPSHYANEMLDALPNHISDLRLGDAFVAAVADVPWPITLRPHLCGIPSLRFCAYIQQAIGYSGTQEDTQFFLIGCAKQETINYGWSRNGAKDHPLVYYKGAMNSDIKQKEEAVVGRYHASTFSPGDSVVSS